MTKILTMKQQAAVDHYRIHGNKDAAYKSSYNCSKMKPETIRKRAVELFDHPKVAGTLREHRAVQAGKLDISENRLLAEFASIGFSNAANLFDEHGTPKNISDMDIPTQRAIKSVTVKRFIERTGKGEDDYEDVEIQKIELHPKLPALIKIAEIKGIAQSVDKNMQKPVEVTVNINGQSAEIK